MSLKDTQTSAEISDKLSNLEELLPGRDGSMEKLLREFAVYLSKRRIPLHGMTPEQFDLNCLLATVELQENNDGFGKEIDSPLVCCPWLVLDIMGTMKTHILAAALYSPEFAAKVKELNQAPATN